ncbi:MAG: DUF882 domain-containing protein [Myxococcota bacterium]
MWRSALLGAWCVGVLACNPTQAEPPTPQSTQQHTATTPARIQESAPQNVVSESASEPSAPSVGGNKGGETHDAGVGLGVGVAQMVRDGAQATVKRRLDARVPGVVFQASQQIHLSAWSGDIAAQPITPDDVPKATKERARKRRRRIGLGKLSLFYMKTGASVEVQLYDDAGRMRPEAYARLSKLLVDTGSPRHDGSFPWVAYHPRLFAMLYFVAQKFDRQLIIVSAYRAPSRSSRKRSYHTRACAVDFTIRKIKRQKILAYVENSFSRIGVGWYPNSTFIHLDTRKRTYHWVDRSGPGERQRTRRRRIRRRPRRGTDPVDRTVHIAPNVFYQRR